MDDSATMCDEIIECDSIIEPCEEETNFNEKKTT